MRLLAYTERRWLHEHGGTLIPPLKETLLTTPLKVILRFYWVSFLCHSAKLTFKLSYLATFSDFPATVNTPKISTYRNEINY